MASLSQDKAGRRLIQFVGADGKRRTIRLGMLTEKAAEAIRVKVEHLNAAVIAGTTPDDEVTTWLAKKAGDALVARLAAVGLTKARPIGMLGQFTRDYIDRRTDVKPNTVRNLESARTRLVEFFQFKTKGKKDISLRDVTPDDADHFLLWLKERYADGTTGRTVKRARQFFKAAVRANVIAANPFDDVKPPSQANPSRLFFVTAEMATAVLDACPDVQWRTIFALSRYGGLRTPSETLGLEWSDVDWERGRFRVKSPKTEHHEGKGERMVPLFPELRAVLADAFDQAEPGTRYVVTRCRDAGTNLRTQMFRIIRRAGLTPWPKLFHNLRATRETELAQQFPMHVVCAWIGNTEGIALRHYLQVTDDDFRAASEGARAAESAARALHNPMQQPSAKDRTESQDSAQVVSSRDLMPSIAEGCERAQSVSVPPRGGELVRENPAGLRENLDDEALRAAVDFALNDPVSSRILLALPGLTATMRAAVLAMVEAAR